MFFNPETIGETVQRRLAPAGCARSDSPEHAAPCSGIQRAGRQADGRLQHDQRRNAKPFAIGGGTYAPSQGGRGLRHALPGRTGLEHQANESIDVANFVKRARIYATPSSHCAPEREERHVVTIMALTADQGGEASSPSCAMCRRKSSTAWWKR
ncbi:MAG: hypothetical protein ACLUI3_09180 [Christensenellales bacterium]